MYLWFDENIKCFNCVVFLKVNGLTVDFLLLLENKWSVEILESEML